METLGAEDAIPHTEGPTPDVPSANAPPRRDTLTGTVERVVYRSPDLRFVVARFQIEGVTGQRTYDERTTIVGDLGEIPDGVTLRVGGEWERHPRHGRHFRVTWLEQRLPATVAGIERFLGSGIIKGIGPATARLVVDALGEETLEVIDLHPERLRRVRGLGGRKAELICRGWRAQRGTRELLLFLQSHNIPPFLARRIRDQYGDQCMAVMQKNPYRLAQEVQGIGFKTADDMALKLGLPPVSTSRFVACIKHVLEEASREGHVFLPKGEALSRASRLLSVPPDLVESGLLEASRQGVVVIDGEALYLTGFFRAERSVARALARLLSAPSFAQSRGRPRPDPTKAVEEALAALGITLADRQQEAVRAALGQKIVIITGGPGTGKTMCLHVLIAALDRAALPYALCAPTGRAAKRMTAATGRAASTIHRLLGYQPGTNDFAFDDDHRLPSQFLIVDEVSMIDLLLFHHLLRGLPDDGHLVLVGDDDQLPAVGAGNVLRDLLDSGAITTVTLDELFRQSEGSQITKVAHQIRRGEVPAGVQSGDLYLVPVRDAEHAQQVITEMVAKRIPGRFGFDPKLDIQVLCPTHRGPAGVARLNAVLQDLLNPRVAGASQGLARGAFRVGDKVMQMRNNYDKDVFNGDVGTVEIIDPETETVAVRFVDRGPTTDESRLVDYEPADFGDLALAYAVSVHKAQGSEFECVVIPLLTSHYVLLQRNLLYTALTRARRLCVLVYQPRALPIAVSSNRRDARFSRLTERIRDQLQQD